MPSHGLKIFNEHSEFQIGPVPDAFILYTSQEHIKVFDCTRGMKVPQRFQSTSPNDNLRVFQNLLEVNCAVFII